MFVLTLPFPPLQVLATSDAPVPRMGAVDPVDDAELNALALKTRFGPSLATAAASRVSLAVQPARNSRVQVGDGAVTASSVPSHVAGYRRSNSVPVDIAAAEAAMRQLMAGQGTPPPADAATAAPPAALQRRNTASGSPTAASVSPASSAASSPRPGVVPVSGCPPNENRC